METPTNISPLLTSVALAIPAYNEADGIEEFLLELDASLSEIAGAHWFCVFDDTSSDDTVAVLDSLVPRLSGTLLITRNLVNLGHGPTVRRAYEAALGTDADWILQVDGDGQFLGSDLEKLARAAVGPPSHDIVTAARDRRFDPWYRTVLTTSLPVALKAGFGVSRGDVNCPLRLYTADAIRTLLPGVPSDSLTPHVLLTILEEKSDFSHTELTVTHRPRRGDSEVGTTWRQGRNLIVPTRLVKFCATAASQLVDFRRNGQSSG